MSKELKARTRKFSIDNIALCAAVPRRFETQHIQGQLLRSSSSVASNYRAACRARSRGEFVAKLGIVEEECDETQFWLELLRDALLMLKVPTPPNTLRELSRLAGEAEEILRITIASKKTAKANA